MRFNLTGVRDPRVRAMRDPDLARRMQHPWIWQVATKNGTPSIGQPKKAAIIASCYRDVGLIKIHPEDIGSPVTPFLLMRAYRRTVWAGPGWKAVEAGRAGKVLKPSEYDREVERLTREADARNFDICKHRRVFLRDLTALGFRSLDEEEESKSNGTWGIYVRLRWYLPKLAKRLELKHKRDMGLLPQPKPRKPKATKPAETPRHSDEYPF